MVQHILKTQTFDRKFLRKVFNLSRDMREVALRGGDESLKGRIVSTLFYEPSTRTRLSFESAAMRLGARVLSTESAGEFSSATKGEILEDTIRVLQSYCDCIVLRYHETGGVARAAHVSSVPIINAGDGRGQHPTQSLLDLFTIEDEIGNVDGLQVVLAGDLKNGRTIHSLAYLLGKFKDVNIYFASPPGLEIPDGILDYLERHNTKFFLADSLKRVVEKVPVNVVYQTRIQKERIEIPTDGRGSPLVTYEECKDHFTVTRDLVKKMHPDAIVLHPMPRVDEIRYGVDDDPRAKYFRQAENGLYVRMALLKILLGN